MTQVKKQPFRILKQKLIDIDLMMPWDSPRHKPIRQAKGVNRHAVRAPVVDLEEPEGATKWGFVSGCMAGLRHRHDSLPKSKESQIRALEKGRHQHSSSLATLVLTLAFERPDPANGDKR